MKRFHYLFCKWRYVLLLWVISAPACADEWALVTRAIDGDTVEIENNIRLRLIGINAPERSRLDRVAQPGAQRAYLWLRNAIEGQRIWLQFDDERIDSYQRQLVYVFNTQGEHINQQLLLNGLATLSLHPPNLRYQFELSQAQDTARRQGRGIWGDPEYAPMPMSSLNRGSIGQWGRFYGVVNRIEQLKTGVRLWFNAKTYVWIPFRFLSYFGTLDDYRDHKLEVMAWPGKRGEKYSLLVRHPSQLKCLVGRCLEFE